MVTDIAISSISMYQNYRDVEPPSEKDEDVIELSKSIQKLGVMQPVLLRQDPAKKDKYQLIFGHRRLMAAKVAGLAAIPASVREVADDDILELQVTENLQRKDVHPMDEAIAFKSLMEKKSVSADEIAARFAKKPEYVVQRLKLNDLIPELQSAFKKNTILLGHALLLARLTAADQKETWSHQRSAVSVADLKDYIERNIMRNLSSAPWKKDDATLLPAAGPCNACQKRTGCNQLLFGDMAKGQDRCSDKKCFDAKAEAFFILELRSIIETKPDVKLLAYEKPSGEVAKLLKELNVKPLSSSNNEYSTYTYNNFRLPAKGFYINGWQKGKTEKIYLPGKAQASKRSAQDSSEPSAAEKKEMIKAIQDREKRAKELDAIKIHKATLASLEDHKAFEAPGVKFQPIDRGVMVFLLIITGGWQLRDALDGMKWFPEEPDENYKYQHEYFEKLAKISDDQLAYIIRWVCMDKWGNKNLTYGISTEDTTLRLIAEYLKLDLKKIEDEQGDIAAARQERVKKRIADLTDHKQEKKYTKESAVKKTPAKKSATPKPVKKNAK